MMDFIMVPTIMAIITLGIYKLFELFVCKKERLMLIEKMGDKYVPDVACMPKLYGNFSFSALKLGCLLVGMGLGLLIGFVICTSAIPGYLDKDVDTGVFIVRRYLWFMELACFRLEVSGLSQPLLQS